MILIFFGFLSKGRLNFWARYAKLLNGFHKFQRSRGLNSSVAGLMFGQNTNENCARSFSLLLLDDFNLLFLLRSVPLCFAHLFGKHIQIQVDWPWTVILCQVMNLLLGGAAVQGSRKLLTAWLVWHFALVLLYWTWWASMALIVVWWYHWLSASFGWSGISSGSRNVLR